MVRKFKTIANSKNIDMATKQAKSKGSAAKAPAKKASAPKKAASKNSAGNGGTSEKLLKVFEDGLKDIYWAEKALTKALPKMAKNATAPELKTALQDHLAETEGQVERLEQIFELLGKKAQAKKCEAMAGLIKEGDEMMEDNDKGVMRDVAIISAGQKVEHYEIASYGTLRAFAEILGLNDAAELLQETLDEEKGADEKLTEVTSAAVVLDSDEDDDSEEEEEDDEE